MAEDLMDQRWVVVNDTVMGGRSSGSISIDEDSFQFSGSVSLENNGGFASVRLQATPLLEGKEGLRIRASGEEKSYQLVVWMGQGPRLYYKTEFSPSAELQHFSFADFSPVSYGRSARAPSLESVLSRVSSVGILIGDGQEGDFQLQILTLESYGEAQETPEEQLSSEVLMSLQRAVQRGVPVYNQGAHAECAAIYQTVLEDLLFLKASELSAFQRARIEKVLSEAKLMSSPNQRAWAFRDVIDLLMMG